MSTIPDDMAREYQSPAETDIDGDLHARWIVSLLSLFPWLYSSQSNKRSVCIVSILRIVAFDGSKTDDPLYTTIDTAMWSSVEQSVGIICACLPTLRPLFRRIYDVSHGSSLEKGSGSRTQSINIRMSHLGSHGDENGSTVCFARTPTERTRSRASSTPQARMDRFEPPEMPVPIMPMATAGRGRSESNGIEGSTNV